MATIRKRVSQGRRTRGSRIRPGVRYQAIVELKGLPVERQTFPRKSEAQEWAYGREVELRQLRKDPRGRSSSVHTVAELVDRHLERLKFENSPHYGKRKQQLEWWKAQIGALALTQVTPAVLVQQRDRLLTEISKRGAVRAEGGRRRSPATANRYLAALSRAFSDAVEEWSWLSRNPVHGVRRRPESTGRLRYLSLDERDSLLKACRTSSMRELELVVMLALTTGMRRGELLGGLRWPDIDRQRGLIILHKTKNRERRSVPIDGTVSPLLERHETVRRLGTDLVFPHPVHDDKPLPIDDAFQAALAAAEISDFRFHDLRHTAASYLAMSGATTAEIAAVLGHKTLQMVKRYAHLSDQHTGQVVRRMTEKFFSAG